MSKLNEKNFREAAVLIESWRRPLLVSHVKPDGDALGALVAMRAMLASRGVSAVAVLFDPIPGRYSMFHRYEPMPVYGDAVQESDLNSADGVVLLDTCAYSQVDPVAEWLKASPVPKVAIDHHITRDDLADGYVIDESAAATCLILYDWTQTLGWSVGSDCAEALFIGMAMDTGWFQHANTDHRVLKAATDLVGRGVCPNELSQQLFQRESPARVRLLGAALGTLELAASDRTAVMSLSMEAIAKCGATRTDTEDIVNEPLRIGSVAVSVLLVEQADGLVRVSFRSKEPFEMDTDAGAPPQGTDVDVDVAKVAEAFGGGGHTRAAGARIKGTLSDARRMLVEHLEQFLPA